jgi:hypothetical protein
MTRFEDLQPTKRKHNNPQTRVLSLKVPHLTYKWNHKPDGNPRKQIHMGAQLSTLK